MHSLPFPGNLTPYQKDHIRPKASTYPVTNPRLLIDWTGSLSGEYDDYVNDQNGEPQWIKDLVIMFLADCSLGHSWDGHGQQMGAACLESELVLLSVCLPDGSSQQRSLRNENKVPMNQEQKTNNIILLLLAVGGILIHILLNGQYGFHRDELDVIMNARQLDWGYVAYPPFTPFLARIEL